MTDAATLAEAEAELSDIADNIRRFHKAAMDGLKQESDGVAAFRSSTMPLARELIRGRQRHQNDNNAFGAWLKANGLGDDFISKDDRAALIGMAEHPEIAEAVLNVTGKRSWRTIWLDEIVPKVEAEGGFRSPAKTSDGKQRPGRPRGPSLPSSKRSAHARPAPSEPAAESEDDGGPPVAVGHKDLGELLSILQPPCRLGEANSPDAGMAVPGRVAENELQWS
jgi:hypothetical protein